MLNLLNTKASMELKKREIEEASETASQAMNYFLSTYFQPSVNNGKSHQHQTMLLCQVKVSALLLRKIGLIYQEMGEERDDEGLVKTGKDLLARSTLVLKITQPLGETQTVCNNTFRDSKNERSK